jgi:hypothetical protein
MIREFPEVIIYYIEWSLSLSEDMVFKLSLEWAESTTSLKKTCAKNMLCMKNTNQHTRDWYSF